jgi:arylsulfatase A-like enzyme
MRLGLAGCLRFVTLVAIALWCGVAAHARPNFVVIVADDLGYGDLGIHGGRDVPTPHIDSLAQGGVRCTDGYVSCPVCSPTRAGLLTGRYQQRFGHEFNTWPSRAGEAGSQIGLPLDQVTLADVLKRAGYATAIIGKWHLGYGSKFQPQQRGFDEFFGPLDGSHAYFPGADPQHGPIYRGAVPVEEKEYLTDAFGREAVAFVERHARDPFFLLLTFNAVHAPLEAPQQYLSRVAHVADRKRRTYCAMLSALDDAVGRVLKSLDQAKLAENTLVAFISDNGWPQKRNASSNAPLSGNKSSLSEGGIRVPFLMRWKGQLAAGQVYGQPVISLDIFPTIAAAAGAEVPGNVQLDGVNLLPFLTGSAAGPPHETLYWRYGPQQAVRQGNYKLLKRRDREYELYDLAQDVGEKRDLATAQPDVVKQLAALYDRWNTELMKPRWHRQPENNE